VVGSSTAPSTSEAIERVRSAARGTPDHSVTTHTYSGSWPETEPSVSTYHYSYGPWIYFYER
jgi:hypothetical protein